MTKRELTSKLRKAINWCLIQDSNGCKKVKKLEQVYKGKLNDYLIFKIVEKDYDYEPFNKENDLVYYIYCKLTEAELNYAERGFATYFEQFDSADSIIEYIDEDEEFELLPQDKKDYLGKVESDSDAFENEILQQQKRDEWR